MTIVVRIIIDYVHFFHNSEYIHIHVIATSTHKSHMFSKPFLKDSNSANGSLAGKSPNSIEMGKSAINGGIKMEFYKLDAGFQLAKSLNYFWAHFAAMELIFEINIFGLSETPGHPGLSASR